MNYSTTEHVIGTCPDGSTLYEKSIDFGALPNNTSKTVNHNISNLGIVYAMFGTTARSDGTGHPLPIVAINGADVGSQTYMYYNKTAVGIVTNSDRSSYVHTWLTMHYSKTS